MPQIQLAILLGMTVALGPLALDAYLPAFPDISDGLGARGGSADCLRGLSSQNVYAEYQDATTKVQRR